MGIKREMTVPNYITAVVLSKIPGRTPLLYRSFGMLQNPAGLRYSLAESSTRQETGQKGPGPG